MVLNDNNWHQVSLSGSTSMIVGKSFRDIEYEVIWSNNNTDNEGLLLSDEGGRFDRDIYVRKVSTIPGPVNIVIVRS